MIKSSGCSALLKFKAASRPSTGRWQEPCGLPTEEKRTLFEVTIPQIAKDTGVSDIDALTKAAVRYTRQVVISSKRLMH